MRYVFVKFNASYPLLFAAHHKLNPEEVRNLTKALVALAMRHNVICDLDRARLETTVFVTAKIISMVTFLPRCRNCKLSHQTKINSGLVLQNWRLRSQNTASRDTLLAR